MQRFSVHNAPPANLDHRQFNNWLASQAIKELLVMRDAIQTARQDLYASQGPSGRPAANAAQRAV